MISINKTFNHLYKTYLQYYLRKINLSMSKKVNVISNQARVIK